MTFSFNKQLNTGNLGESLFYQAHCGTLNRTDGRKNDFQVKETGEGLELKTDTYSMAKTPNFFIEHISNESKGSPGGPWQSLANGTPNFVYFFVSDLTCFQFKTDELCARLDLIIPTLKPVRVENPKYTTIGYRVPRDTLADIYREYTLTVSLSP
jgi:hypothetical protein